jgi:hypothetical protein
MSNTVFFSVTTSPITTLNTIKVSLHKESDSGAEYTSLTNAGSLGIHTWNFPGLPKTNYICYIREVSGPTILQTYGSFTVTPDNNEYTFRPAEWIRVGVTTGLVAATTTFTFDGTGGTADWLDEDIIVERVGMGTMQKDVDYSWDSATGEFNLLNPGDQFNDQERFHVFFEPKEGTAGGILDESNIFKGTKIVTADETLLAEDAGKKIIIKGVDPYIEVTLPLLADTSENRPFYFESAPGYHDSVKIISLDSNKLDYPSASQNHVILKPGETIDIFKSIDTSVQTWRVHNDNSNIKKVLQEFTSYLDQSDMVNVQELDGTELDVEADARAYEAVLKLPSGARCAYVDWASSPHKFSEDNGSGKFRVPDVTGLYARNASATLDPSTYQENQNKAHSHKLTIRRSNNAYGYGSNTGTVIHGAYDGDSLVTESVGETEARPETYVTRRFIYL